jgi:dynein intermediate chain, cytosolic
VQPTPNREFQKQELDKFIHHLVGDRESRPGSTGPGSPSGKERIRPTSVISQSQLSSDNEGTTAFSQPTGMIDGGMQTLSIGPLATVFEFDAPPKHEKEKEVITYSKGVQTSTDWTPPRSRDAGASDSERDESPTRSPRALKRLSRRYKERDEEIRTQLKKEIEEELKAAQQGTLEITPKDGNRENFPFKTLTNEELVAVEGSEDFVNFVERSTKVLERALDQQLEYDVLADYSHAGLGVDEEDEGYGSSSGKKGRRIREIAQFWDERWSKKRMISDMGFSTKVSICCSWNRQDTDRLIVP